MEKLGRHMQKRRKKCGIAAGDAGDGAEETKRSGEKRKHDRIEEATVEEGRQVQAEDDDTSGL